MNGFEIKQWASNFPSVVNHLLSAARPDSSEIWLNQNRIDPVEGALLLSWHCVPDTLGYGHRPVSHQTLTMTNVYIVLASQYGPSGYIMPFITRVLLQQLWVNNKQWDQPTPTAHLQRTWDVWESELPNRVHISIPRRWDGNNRHVSCKVTENYTTLHYIAFLDVPSTHWPVCPAPAKEITTELRKPLFCIIVQPTRPFDLPDPKEYNTCTT